MDVYPRYSARGNYYIAELAFARGPLSLGTGNNYAQLFGADWMLLADRENNELSLWQHTTGAWLKKGTIDDAPTPLGDMRHISLAFDQQGSAIVAYENSKTSQIYIRQWDATNNTFVYRGPFDGVDPVLVMDAILLGDVEDSDISLFYLNTDRVELMYRLQRDKYDTEYSSYSLSEESFLDQIIILPHRYEVALEEISTGDGTFLLSALYPVRPAEDITTDFITADGTYAVAVLRNAPTEASSINFTTNEGMYAAALIKYPTTDDIATAFDTQEGTYALAIIRYSTAESTQADFQPNAGDYALAIVRYIASEQMSGNFVATDGRYSL